jgi:hypothetical protein
MLDRVPVGKITAQAREVHFWRTVLTVAAGLLFGAGWLAAKVLAVGWLAVAWVFVAVREGYREGRKPNGAAG